MKAAQGGEGEQFESCFCAFFVDRFQLFKNVGRLAFGVAANDSYDKGLNFRLAVDAAFAASPLAIISRQARRAFVRYGAFPVGKGVFAHMGQCLPQPGFGLDFSRIPACGEQFAATRLGQSDGFRKHAAQHEQGGFGFGSAFAVGGKSGLHRDGEGLGG